MRTKQTHSPNTQTHHCRPACPALSAPKPGEHAHIAPAAAWTRKLDFSVRSLTLQFCTRTARVYTNVEASRGQEAQK